jgi:hypothetical protein
MLDTWWRNQRTRTAEIPAVNTVLSVWLSQERIDGRETNEMRIEFWLRHFNTTQNILTLLSRRALIYQSEIWSSLMTLEWNFTCPLVSGRIFVQSLVSKWILMPLGLRTTLYVFHGIRVNFHVYLGLKKKQRPFSPDQKCPAYFHFPLLSRLWIRGAKKGKE